MPSRTVLVVDQRATVRSRVKESLRGEDCRVLAARDGLEALCVCALRPVDVLLLSRDLPGISAAAVAEKLALPFPGTPVLQLAEAEERGALRERVQKALRESTGPRRPAGTTTGASRRRSA